MNKNLIIRFGIALFPLISSQFYSQVGINTDKPAATLDVVKNPTANVLDGIIAPRLSADELNNKTYTPEQNGAFVYITQSFSSTTSPTSQTLLISEPGYYLFDSNIWKRFDNDQEFVKFSENGKTGYATKYRKNNPTFYGDIGTNAIDLSYSASGGNFYGARGDYSVIVGGQNSLANSTNSGIFAGTGGQATNTNAVVIGGNGSSASGTNSAAIGGVNNSAIGQGSFVAGAGSNYAYGTSSTIGGGGSNNVNGLGSVISGGGTNSATSNFSSIGGGYTNSATSTYATISGGFSNSASANASSISGGGNNSATAAYSTISGGSFNKTNGQYSTISGGRGNTAFSYSEWVAGNYNTSYTALSTSAWNNADRLFTIGNGTSDTTRSDALIILKNGLTTLPSTTTTQINNESTGKVVVTKEWVNLRVPSPPATGTYILKSVNGVTSWVTP